MSTQLDLDDVAAQSPLAQAELTALREKVKELEKYERAAIINTMQSCEVVMREVLNDAEHHVRNEWIRWTQVGNLPMAKQAKESLDRVHAALAGQPAPKPSVERSRLTHYGDGICIHCKQHADDHLDLNSWCPPVPKSGKPGNDSPCPACNASGTLPCAYPGAHERQSGCIRYPSKLTGEQS